MYCSSIWETLTVSFSELLPSLGVGGSGRPTLATMHKYIKGLLSRADRKNSWQIAEELGQSNPKDIQYFLCEARLNETFIQQYLFRRIIFSLGQDGILTFDDTGFLKKGDKSAGVQRQYSGTAGRTENCQIGVFMGYKTPESHTLLEGQLYIPESWANDRARCREARIPDEVVYVKKACLASNMYEGFLGQGGRCSYATADSFYGMDPDFRGTLERNKQRYVLAVSKDFKVNIGPLRLNHSVNKFSDENCSDFVRLSAGEGSKGERLYDWLLVERNERKTPDGYKYYLLVRRSISDPKELAYYTCFVFSNATLQEIVNVAASRWSIEECFEMAKGETGLDEYEVRTFHGWKRHILMSLWSLFILVALRQKIPDPFEEEAENNTDEREMDVAQVEPLTEGNPPSETEPKESSLAAFKKKRKLLSLSRSRKSVA